MLHATAVWHATAIGWAGTANLNLIAGLFACEPERQRQRERERTLTAAQRKLLLTAVK